MTLDNPTIIIADDLTGANDCALQYFSSNCTVRIAVSLEQDFTKAQDVDVWSISTESRNIDKKQAFQRVFEVCNTLKDNLNIDNFYKKIDSTLRGNTGLEILAVLEAIGYDAAIVAPAYIEEGRSTIGAYQLVHGTILERTQCALDPKAPINSSYIPDILKKDFSADICDMVATIGFDVVSKGAAPIVLKIQDLIQKGKKIIVLDALSTVDLEQIALAVIKCSKKILPVGSAGLASAINKIKHKDKIINTLEHISNLPKFIVSGTATLLGANQIKKLKDEKPKAHFIDLTIKDCINEVQQNLISQIVENLNKGVDVIVHTSNINSELQNEESENILIDAGVAKSELASKITGYLADVVGIVNKQTNFILITVGGETSYACTNEINSKYLQILDAIMPAIPLCIDSNNKIIVTKSGNFGTNSTLVDILNYFDRRK